MPSISPRASAMRPVSTSPLNRLSSAGSILPARRRRTCSLKLSWMSCCSAESRATSDGSSGRKRIEQGFSLSGGIKPTLDAETLDQAMHAETRRDHPDRAEQRAFLGPDLVAGERQPVPARCGNILGERENRDPLLRRRAAGCGETAAPIAPASRPANLSTAPRRAARCAEKARSSAAAWLASDIELRDGRGVITPSKRITVTTGAGLRNRSSGSCFRTSRRFMAMPQMGTVAAADQ